MRIVSKYHDYYDTALGYGQDPALVYRREAKYVEFERWPGDRLVLRVFGGQAGWYRFPAKLVVVAFCGRIFPLWIDRTTVLSPDSLSTQTKSEIVLSDDEVIKRTRKEHADHAPTDRYARRWLSDYEKLIANVAGFRGRTVSRETFLQVGAPVFVAYIGDRWFRNGLSVITNPRLALFGFQRVLDPFTAFQEIAMFLGSALAPEDTAPRTVGGDEVIAASKGFDEFSFRTQAPGQKKLNRTANRKRKKGDG